MSEPTWLEVSLIVNGELAEAVADVLARFAPNGVVIESTAVYADPEDEGHAVGPLKVCAYLPMDAQLEETRRRLEEALWYLGRISPLPPAQFKPIEEVNWFEAWKQHYKPIPIGRRLLILPAWMEPTDPQRIAIRIDPGMAFGTGTHPTTQLCLELLEAWSDRHPECLETVLDVGCGSGILAVAALEMGANCAVGVDIDKLAIDASRQNAVANQVSEKLVLGVGSVAEVRRGDFPLRQAHVVFANILAPVLVRLFQDGLAELARPDGVVILSGILAEQEADVLMAAQAHGLKLLERRQEMDWVALALVS